MEEIKRFFNRKNITAFITAIIFSVLGFIIMQPDMDTEVYNKQKKSYIERYATSVSDVLKRADNMLAFDIFTENNPFSIKNINKTKEDYTRVQNLTLEMDNDKVSTAVLDYRYISIIVVILMLYIIYNTCNERKNGMMEITYSSCGGRKKLALKRSLFFFAAPFIAVLVMYLINTIVACIMYGIDDFSGPVQTIAAFEKYTYLHSKGEYLVIAALKNAFFAGVLTMLVYMVCNIFLNIGIALLFIGAVFVGEWWLFASLTGTSVLKNLKYINIFVLFDGTYFDREYLNVNLFGNCISANGVLLYGSIILLIVAFALSVILYRKREGQLPRFIKKILDVIEINSQKLLAKLPFFLKELWKVLVLKKGVILVAVVIVAFIVIQNNSVAKFGQRNTEIDGIYNQYGGTDWEGYEKYVDEFEIMVNDFFDRAQAIIDGVNAGTEPITRLLEADTLSARGSAAVRYLEEYKEKLAYRERMKSDRGIDIQLVADRKMDAAFDERASRRELLYGIVMLIFVILITSWSFEIEQKAGIMPIIAPTQRGASWSYRKKYIVLTCMLLIGFVVLYGADLIFLINTYNLQSFDAPVQSVYFWENVKINVSIGGYVAIMFGTKLVYMLVIQALTLLFGSGRYVDNRSYTLLFIIGSGICFALLMGLNYVGWLIFTGVGAICYVPLVLWAYKNWRKY